MLFSSLRKSGLSSLFSWVAILLLLGTFFISDHVAAEEEEKCETIEDLDFEKCTPENLSIPELKRVCESVGLDIEGDVFPHMFNDEESAAKPREKGDYVTAAYECIYFADETAHDEESLELLMQESPEYLAGLVSDVLEGSPDLIPDFVKEMKGEEEEVWKPVEDALAAGKMLEDGEMVKLVLRALLEHEVIGLEEEEVFDDDDLLEDEGSLEEEL